MNTDTDISTRDAQIISLENELRQMRMTMRDHYAIAALNGLLACGYSPRDIVVEESFRIANIALEERLK
ncbi:MAG TPA: hypothetical protein PLZ60_10000 [Kiritimatiellia bacterium]|nr:hypothetical protein [Kiritimatiellia bacterium]